MVGYIIYFLISSLLIERYNTSLSPGKPRWSYKIFNLFKEPVKSSKVCCIYRLQPCRGRLLLVASSQPSHEASSTLTTISHYIDISTFRNKLKVSRWWIKSSGSWLNDPWKDRKKTHVYFLSKCSGRALCSGILRGLTGAQTRFISPANWVICGSDINGYNAFYMNKYQAGRPTVKRPSCQLWHLIRSWLAALGQRRRMNSGRTLSVCLEKYASIRGYLANLISGLIWENK